MTSDVTPGSSYLDELVRKMHSSTPLRRERTHTLRIRKKRSKTALTEEKRRPRRYMPLEKRRTLLDRLFPGRRYRGRRTDSEELKRQLAQSTIDGMYKHFVRACRTKRRMYEKCDKLEMRDSWEFLITLEEWRDLWLSCSRVTMVTGIGTCAKETVTPAWKARGRSPKTDVMLKRLNTKLPWTINNVVVVYRGQVISEH